MRWLAFLVIFSILFLTSNVAFAWNGISHYHINQSTGIAQSDIFGISGTGPDMSVQWIGEEIPVLDEDGNNQSWPDYFHSPDPKYDQGTWPYCDKPNFAYLMLKVSGRNGLLSNKEREQALGWGGHIAADWVAHNNNLFPICPDGSPGSIKHFIGECLSELYSFLTKGPIASPSHLVAAFDDRQLYKALFNYRLIAIHEKFIKENKQITDRELKDKALKTTLPREYIRERIKRWLAKLTVIQFAYAMRAATWSPTRISQFINDMELRGIQSNLALSEMAVYAWANNPTPRGNIPDYSKQIVPFYSEKLMSISDKGAPNLAGSNQKNGMYLNSSLRNYFTQQTLGSSINLEDAALWQAIIDTSCQKGYLSINATETPEDLYLVDVAIADEVGLWSLITTEIQAAQSLPSSQKRAVDFWNDLLVKGILDIDLLTQISCSNISIISPLNNSFVNTGFPNIVARVESLYGDTIDDTGSLSLSVDGETASFILDGDLVKCIPSKKLFDGLHEVLLGVIDIYGNESKVKWSFTVDTVPPKPCYKVKSSMVSSKRRAEISAMSNEPVEYFLSVVPVYGGRVVQNSVVYQKSFGQQSKVYWDGTDSRGLKVLPGQYAMLIQAIDRAGNSKTKSFYIRVGK
ncbi:MAG: hypothetical protein QME63_05675 [Actinomycetota bacterium]|nr:hypothetical protein [Actinomycetota bacterium]